MRMLTIAALAAGALLAAGCEANQTGQLLVAPDTSQGKIAEAVAGPSDQLIKQGKIDAQRTVTTSDKTDLDVWLIRGKPAKQGAKPLGTVVMLHGLGQSKAAFPYFGGAFGGASGILAKMGYDVLLIDLRAHGRSTGKYITYGAKEKRDVKAVVDAMADDIHMPLYAFGVNLGGAVAIQYAAIDERCKGVMAIAPYKDFASYARVELFLLLLPPKNVDEAIAAAAKMADFDPNDASAVLAAPNVKCPLLIVHGLLDPTVPLPHSEAIIAAAAGPKRLDVPTVELLIQPAILEHWIAANIDKLAKTGVSGPPVAPKPVPAKP